MRFSFCSSTLGPPVVCALVALIGLLGCASAQANGPSSRDCQMHAVFERFVSPDPIPDGSHDVSYAFPENRPHGMEDSPCTRKGVSVQSKLFGIGPGERAKLKRGVFLRLERFRHGGGEETRLHSIYGESIVEKQRGRTWVTAFIEGSECSPELRGQTVRETFRDMDRLIAQAGLTVYWQIRAEKEFCPQCDCYQFRYVVFLLLRPEQVQKAAAIGFVPGAPPGNLLQ